jgi:Na+-translocating ferredoxin:NAD+ oxidoreductase subunit C
MGGVHPADNKLSAGVAIQDIPLPDKVIVPVVQHVGAPANIIVQVGERIKAGQVLAAHEGMVSANVHASVSGKIESIQNTLDSSGFKHIAITIAREGDEWLENIDRSDVLVEAIRLDSKEIKARVLEMGIVGMGGAAFPSHVKLNRAENFPIDHLIINGVECEPYLTADHRLMLEKPREIIVGIRILMKALGVDNAIIAIENNKQDAIEGFRKLLKNEPGITVEALKVQYPQGSEKQLIQALLKREVPARMRPVHVGVIVHNVGTTYAVYEAIQKNKPLIERVVTVSGKTVKHPSNFMVRIGTPVLNVLLAAGGIPPNTGKIVSGGPMMGKALANVQVPITKGMSGILVIPEKDSKRTEVYNCVHCGKCIEACPMGLEPYRLLVLSKAGNAERAKEEHILDCIECGSCAFVCPSNRAILEYIRFGKTTVKKLSKT